MTDHHGQYGAFRVGAVTRLLAWGLLVSTIMVAMGCGASQKKWSSREAVFLEDKAIDLQALIDQTPDGGVVRIAKGRYTLNKGLVIKGRSQLAILAETGTQILLTDTDQDVLTIENARDIRVFNLLMRHVMPLREYQCHGGVVNIMKSRNIVVANCELNGCGAIGLSAQNTHDLTVEHCYIHTNSFNALYLADVRGFRLWSNVIASNANTLQLYGVDDMQMSDNIIKDNTGYWRKPLHDPGLLEWTPKPRTPQPEGGRASSSK